MARGDVTVERTSIVPHPPEAVWAWHARPGAFERLTPPWERVRILDRGAGLAEGSRAVLEVTLGPARLRWVARHRDVRPGHGFVDEQEAGPFARWVHEHHFAPAAGGGCAATDRITCRPPLGALGSLAGGPFLRATLDRMLRYRHAVLAADLAAHARGGAPRHVAVTGSSGLIGSALVPFLTAGGHRVTRLVRRRPAAPDEVAWDPARGVLEPASLAGVDAVVHLAAEGIADRRWTADRKAALRESRVGPTALLSRTLARLAPGPAALVSVSGVGIFGSRGDETLPDDAAPGTGFLAELAQAWEAATHPATEAGLRVAIPRFGVVLTPAGGALARMLPPFLAGVGGPIGGGRQWMSWCTLDDAVQLLHAAITRDDMQGAFNAVAPEPVRSAAFARALGRVLRRPAVLPAPAPALELLFGEMARETLLASTRAVPVRLAQWHHPFLHPALEPGLRHLLGR